MTPTQALQAQASHLIFFLHEVAETGGGIEDDQGDYLTSALDLFNFFKELAMQPDSYGKVEVLYLRPPANKEEYRELNYLEFLDYLRSEDECYNVADSLAPSIKEALGIRP